jgi:NADH-quinone oxidoreductase subunit L
MTFHGKNRADEHTRKHLHESPGVVTLPLIALAIPSVIAGFLYFEPVISGAHFGDSIFVLEQHDVTAALAEGYHGKTGFALVMAAMTHGIMTAPFWLAVGGVFFAWYCYCRNTEMPGKIVNATGPVYRILVNKYGFDDFYQAVFARGTVVFGKVLYQKVDAGLIDGTIVNGTANTVAAFAAILRQIQTGYTYHYAFAMIIGLFALITVFVWI